MAAPLMVEELEEPEMTFPWLPPYTVDTLFELPDTNGLRFEVLGGSLVVSPPPPPDHNLAADRLGRLIFPLLPLDTDAITAVAVRLPNGDGPVPDLLFTTGDPSGHAKGLPAALVHTVVEVVSPSNANSDRRTKLDLYAEAGIPCYWRVERRPWREHFGPVPAIVVRLLNEDGEWIQTIAPAGTVAELPVVVDKAGTIVTVKIDPAVLVGKRSA
jgi:Uma2 family endonuclease